MAVTGFPTFHPGVEPMTRFDRSRGFVRTAALILTGLGSLGCGESPVMATYTGDDRVVSFMQADYTRFYRVHVPMRSELGPAAPVVLAFHGSGQTGEQLRALTTLDRTADSAGFIVVYPEAAMGNWDVFGSVGYGLDELAYVREVIDRVDRAYVIDDRKIIAVGLSNGGVMAQQLACRMADRIAGFVAVGASLSHLQAEGCQPDRPVSGLFLLGTVDPFFPAAGNSTLLSFDGTMQFWASVNHCAGDRLRTSLPDRTDDGTMVYQSRYRPCRDGSRVELDSIVGGGHRWPGAAITGAGSGLGLTSQDISANAEIVRFLGTIPRR